MWATNIRYAWKPTEASLTKKEDEKHVHKTEAVGVSSQTDPEFNLGSPTGQLDVLFVSSRMALK